MRNRIRSENRSSWHIRADFVDLIRHTCGRLQCPNVLWHNDQCHLSSTLSETSNMDSSRAMPSASINKLMFTKHGNKFCRTHKTQLTSMYYIIQYEMIEGKPVGPCTQSLVSVGVLFGSFHLWFNVVLFRLKWARKSKGKRRFCLYDRLPKSPLWLNSRGWVIIPDCVIHLFQRLSKNMSRKLSKVACQCSYFILNIYARLSVCHIHARAIFWELSPDY